MHDRAGQEFRADRMQLILKPRYDAEIPAAATQTPEQVRVLADAGPFELTRGGNDVI